ncbi:MAG: flagellar hook-length control protein FliK [Pseudomonadota bacterium]
MDRVIGSVRLRENGAVIKLFPPSLGEVRVKLVFKEDQLNTTFIIDNQKVKEIVEGGLSNLRTALLDQGIKLGECNVELNQNFSRFFGGEERDANPAKWAWYKNGSEAWSQPEQEMSILAARGSPDAGIDLFA